MGEVVYRLIYAEAGKDDIGREGAGGDDLFRSGTGESGSCGGGTDGSIKRFEIFNGLQKTRGG